MNQGTVRFSRGIGTIVMLMIFLVFGVGPATAQDRGLENLRQTGQAFRSVAKKVSPAIVFIKVEKELSTQAPPVQFFSPFDSPFGLSHTLTAGIVSAKGRSGIGLNDYEDFIQTDAAINPGNSGGPLVNLDGEVVGINSAIFSRSGGYMGIGFAIPVNMAKKVRDQLIEYGEVRRGRLGVYIQEMTKDLAESFGLDNAAGILITQVIEDSPAAAAGLRQGDIILELNRDKVDNVANFRNRIALTAPGTKVRLTVLRDGDRKQLTATIGKLETDKAGYSGGSDKVPTIGLSLQTLTPAPAEQLGYQDEKGVLVAAVETGSLAERAGFSRGDLILEIDRQPVTSVQQAKKLLREKGQKVHLFLVRQGQATRYIAIKPRE